MTLTDNLIECSRNTNITVTNFSEVLVELKRIGNNLNQITAKINAGVFRSYNFYEVIGMQRAIYEEVRRIGGGD